MPQNPLTLFVDHQFTSPYAMSVYVTLREKGIPFVTERLDLGEQQHQQTAYRQQSLTARVPTLVHEGFALSESSAISEYLEEVFAPPTFAAAYPQDVQQRARARQVQAWLRSDLMPLRSERGTDTVFIQPTTTPLSATALQTADKLFRVAEQLLPAGASHLFGNWCIADTDLALMLMRLVANGDVVPERLKTYATQQWQRPSVQHWVQQPRT
ncbi:glutathione S-transferase YfcF [Rhodoferax lithotrophicus]|uniref:Glutathione S-transferase YfcF n=1 Tax=Rhodoferax lithotrophicus TaxID=2798804 RepID=A0ABN6D3J2_9BURK|nr:glutathione transferase [Rhodoferax sp. MIZ03]BCO25384.1 glutathione S-transferase YfcF [Rhodoferax sp. MIZ03]